MGSTIKVNSDGAVDPLIRVAGIVVIARDSYDNLVGGFSRLGYKMHQRRLKLQPFVKQ